MPPVVDGTTRAHRAGSDPARGGPPSPGDSSRPGAVLRRGGRALWEVLPAWLVARLVVAVALVGAHLSVGTVRPGNAAAAARVGQGLLAWDGGWYRTIAAHGYAAAGQESLRFFPAFPMAARVLGGVPGVGVGPALVVVANAASLVALALLAALVRDDLGDGALARRSVWLLALAPAAYTLVLGYSDGLLLVETVAVLWAARRQAWWWAAAAGLAAGLTRPVGLLVAVPVVIEVGRAVLARRGAASDGAASDGAASDGAASDGVPAGGAETRRTAAAGVPHPWGAGRVAGAAAAVVAPAVGAGAFLVWVGSAFGDAWLPFRIQEQGGHRGSLVLPLRAMAHDVASALGGHHVGSALHVPWILLCIVLVVVAFRRLPSSYGALATAMLVVSLTSNNLDSFERYALGAFPLVVAASTLTGRRRVEIVVLVLAGAVMAAYAYGAFVNVLVP